MTKDEIIAMGQRLRKARKTKELTQAEVANGIGVSVKHYNCLERGACCISIKSLLKFVSLTDAELEYILTGKVTKRTDLSFFAKYNSLSPVARQELETILDSILRFNRTINNEDQ